MVLQEENYFLFFYFVAVSPSFNASLLEQSLESHELHPQYDHASSHYSYNPFSMSFWIILSYLRPYPCYAMLIIFKRIMVKQW